MPYFLPSERFIADILQRRITQGTPLQDSTGIWLSDSDVAAKLLYTEIKRKIKDLSQADWSYNHSRYENRTIRASVRVPTKQGRSEAAIEIKLPPRKRVTVNATIVKSPRLSIRS